MRVQSNSGDIVCTPPFCCGRAGGGGGWGSNQTFEKGGGLGRISFSRGGVAGKEGVTFFRGRKGLQFSHKHKLKSEIFDDKKVYKQKMFISVITKNLNWEILTKNLVKFKRWDGVKDKKWKTLISWGFTEKSSFYGGGGSQKTNI